jgi:hypothetical protein
MSAGAHFYCSSHADVAQLGLVDGSVVFHGDVVDERGQLTLDLGPSHHKVPVSYNVQDMTITVAGETIGADVCEKVLAPYLEGRDIVLEATTLGFAELFCLTRALLASGKHIFQITYAEPARYNKPAGGGESYALSEIINGYAPIPHAVVDLSSEEVEAGVFFLGYEQERMARALEEYQMISSKLVKVVFGVPAFRAGWELNAIVPHLQVLSEQHGFEIAYCSANDPGSAFECLERTLNSLSNGARMFIAPIGTKPCGVATAVFASLFPAETGILYDHPKKKPKRSFGVHIWHKYVVRIRA